jgi:hypothetical protein
MNTVQLRQALHEYIDQADEKAIQLMYSFLNSQDKDKDDFEMPEEHKQIVDQRLKEYYENPRDVLTLEEMKEKYGYKK